MTARCLATTLALAVAGCNGFVAEGGKVRNRRPGDPYPAAPAEESAKFLQSGLAKADRNDLRGAAIDLDRAVNLQPESVAARLARASVRERLGDPEAALADYEEVLTIDPGSGAAHAGRGAMLAAVGRFDDGLADLDRALQRDPRRPEFLRERGEIRLTMSAVLEGRDRGAEARDSLKAAVQDFTDAMATRPDLPRLYELRGQARAMLGDRAAEGDIRQALARAQNDRDRERIRRNLDVLKSRTGELRPDPALPKRD